MQDRPSAIELLRAVEEFLEREVVPELAEPKRFHARVAANVMRIVARELELGEAHRRHEWRRLSALLADAGEEPRTLGELDADIRRKTEVLCERIRNGAADHGSWRTKVLDHVRRTVEDKLAIANPKMNPAQPVSGAEEDASGTPRSRRSSGR